MRDLQDIALDTARSAGAEYADIRISNHRTQNIRAREERVQSVSNRESFGFGVRVLVRGTWGFASSHVVDKNEIAKVTKRAVAIAKANRVIQNDPVILAPVKAYEDTWKKIRSMFRWKIKSIFC